MSANPSKLPRLQEVAFGDIAKMKVLIVPDDYPTSRAFENIRVRLKRSTVARLFREWRREGGRVGEGQPLASMILWLALSGMEIVKSKK